MAGYNDADARVERVLADGFRSDVSRLEHDTVLEVLDADNLPEHPDQPPRVRVAAPKEVEVFRRTMGLPQPQGEQRRALEHEVIGVGRTRQPVQQSLDGEANQQALEVRSFSPRDVEQASAYRGGVMAPSHDSVSR